ncbi:uncharacterized protein [Rutidosis leptorrhynchoides]|uniref:uncharacterized protein n=1 Tax=Rutidosis leptorrhynchoides TaxID=125765 RepID=UPI003A99633F
MENDVWNLKWSRDNVGGRNEQYIDDLKSLLQSVSITNEEDKVVWGPSMHGNYTISGARRIVDENILPNLQQSTRWIKFIPIKVNIFIWRVTIDKLPTRYNLLIRGVDIQDIGCPHCDCGVEDLNHVLFSCVLARDIWRKIGLWTNVMFVRFDSWTEWLSWFDNWAAPANIKDRLNVIVATLVWVIWRFPNGVIFSATNMSRDELYDSIRSFSYSWLSSRCKYQIN